MRTGREPKLRPRMQHAVEELKGLVRERYPEATFHLARSAEEPRIVHLFATVDVEDTDPVLDSVIDRVTQLQTEEHLPIHVIPVRPRGSVPITLPSKSLAALQTQAKKSGANRLSLEDIEKEIHAVRQESSKR